jgi:anion-transporting  ArsA/GET3 family ATPase
MSDREPDPGLQPPYLEERIGELERDIEHVRRRLDNLETLSIDLVTLLREMRAAVQAEPEAKLPMRRPHGSR